jgi:hypothetical protein
MNAHKWCAVLLVSGTSLLASAAGAQPRPECLALRDLQNLQATSGTSAIATTRRDAYMITFRGYCQAKSSAAYFIMRQPPLGFCLQRGDRLEVSVPAPPCVVASVTYLRSVRQTDAR